MSGRPVQRRPDEAATGTRAGDGRSRYGASSSSAASRAFELLDLPVVGALLRPEDARRAALAEQRVAHVARDADRDARAARAPTTASIPAPPSTVAVPPTQTSNDVRLRRRASRGAARRAPRRRAQRIELVGAQQRQPERSGRLDDRRPVRQQRASAPSTGRPKRIADDRGVPARRRAPRAALRRFPRRRRRRAPPPPRRRAPAASPRASCRAASSGVRTPLRLAGDASATMRQLLLLELLARRPRRAPRSASASRTTGPRAPGRCRPTPIPTDASIAWRPMPNAMPCA